jgi:hypothetical protein
VQVSSVLSEFHIFDPSDLTRVAKQSSDPRAPLSQRIDEDGGSLSTPEVLRPQFKRYTLWDVWSRR